MTTYLLEHHGYGVSRYVSLEQLIYDEQDDYCTSLAASTTGWSTDGTHDLWPWTMYLLDRLGAAYERFGARIAAGTSGGTKQDRVRDYVLLHAPATFSISDIRSAVPAVSDNTTRRVLTALKRSGKIANDGVGRGSEWRRAYWKQPSAAVVGVTVQVPSPTRQHPPTPTDRRAQRCWPLTALAAAQRGRGVMCHQGRRRLTSWSPGSG